VLQTKVVVLSAKGKGWEKTSQVCAMKLNEGEELMKRRYHQNTVKTSVSNRYWDKFDGNLITGRAAVGVEATGAWCGLL